MFRLRLGYLISGIAIGSILLLEFFWSLPDGKLHLVFCSVGQGDAIYIRFPDGRDMLIDGGPNDKVLGCLGKYMPFWDREINLVAMTHPQKDHLQGLLSVVNRFKINYFVKSDVDNTTEGYYALLEAIKAQKVPVKLVTSGDRISLGRAALVAVWPSEEQVSMMKRDIAKDSCTGSSQECNNVLGTAAPANLNEGSVVFWLNYGNFDALLTGDADSRTEHGYRDSGQALDTVEVLKVPHHGSRSGMTNEFLNWIRPKLAVISVGKNSYGHPASEILEMLRYRDIKILRTDQAGDIEIVSDGKNWEVVSSKQR